jgi:hypothetical protein
VLGKLGQAADMLQGPSQGSRVGGFAQRKKAAILGQIGNGKQSQNERSAPVAASKPERPCKLYP